MHETATHPRVWPLNTDCPICSRSYSAEERVQIGADPNACSGVCLRYLPESVRSQWTVSPGGWVSFCR